MLEDLPKGLAKEVKIELFKDVMLVSPLFYGIPIDKDAEGGGYTPVVEHTHKIGRRGGRIHSRGLISSSSSTIGSH